MTVRALTTRLERESLDLRETAELERLYANERCISVPLGAKYRPPRP